MYEAHFGLSGPPFQLNPDPSFYFDSRGHSHALSYLRYGVYQGEGFIVVTGDIGAGKTTLVRTLLGGLDPKKVVAAQVVSTQLNSGDLLQAIIAAFGIKPLGPTKAQALTTLEAFLTALVTKQRRALLVVDEAQNLNREAIEELRMLSNFQIGHHALLQSFLIGQPELRRMLESKTMEQLRQRVIASCHLGPLDAIETRAYIEHRLHRVGWKSDPTFSEKAFDSIYRHTAGIPRRINLLCNRLLLGAFLSGSHGIDADVVESTSAELLGEVGEAAALPVYPPPNAPLPDAPGVFTPVAIQAQAAPAHHEPAAIDPVQLQRAPVVRPVVALVDSPSDYLKACALHAELVRRGESGIVLINPFREGDVLPAPALSALFTLPAEEIHLGATKSVFRDTAIEVLAALDPLFERLQPRSVCVFGASDGALTATLLARKRSLPVARIDAGQRSAAPGSQRGLNANLLDHLADTLLTSTLTASYSLYREGVTTTRVSHVGSLTSDVLLRMLTSVDATADALMRSLSARGESIETPFILVNAAPRQVAGNFDELRTIVGLLGTAAQAASVIWLADEVTTVALNAARLGPSLRQNGVRLMPPIDGMQTIAMIRRAACIISIGSGELMEESRCLGLPRVVIGRAAPGTETWGGTFTEYQPERLLRALREAIHDREQSQYAVPTLDLAAQATVERILALSTKAPADRTTRAPSLQGA